MGGNIQFNYASVSWYSDFSNPDIIRQFKKAIMKALKLAYIKLLKMYATNGQDEATGEVLSDLSQLHLDLGLDKPVSGDEYVRRLRVDAKFKRERILKFAEKLYNETTTGDS